MELEVSYQPHFNTITKTGDANFSKIPHAVAELIDNSIQVRSGHVMSYREERIDGMVFVSAMQLLYAQHAKSSTRRIRRTCVVKGALSVGCVKPDVKLAIGVGRHFLTSSTLLKLLSDKSYGI